MQTAIIRRMWPVVLTPYSMPKRLIVVVETKKYGVTKNIFSGTSTRRPTSPLLARLPYRYCSKTVSQRHPQIYRWLFSRSCASCSTDTVVLTHSHIIPSATVCGSHQQSIVVPTLPHTCMCTFKGMDDSKR